MAEEPPLPRPFRAVPSMINRYDRIDPVRAARARLSSFVFLGKNRHRRRGYEQRSFGPCSRARGSNRFKPIRIRNCVKPLPRVRRASRGKTAPGGLLTARCRDLAPFRNAPFVSRALFYVGDHTRARGKNLSSGSMSRMRKSTHPPSSLAWEGHRETATRDICLRRDKAGINLIGVGDSFAPSSPKTERTIVRVIPRKSNVLRKRYEE